MYIKTTYDDDFDALWMHLRGKYPKELFNLDGIGDQLDLSKFSKKFFASSVTADASIDANANVDDVSIIAYTIELKKPFERINSYYMLWKELRRLFGGQVANEIIELQLSGDIYIHDFHGIGAGISYCWNYSTYDVMIKGLPMIKKINSVPPKYLYAFKSQLEQFITIAANSTLGASGIADLFIVMSYYVKNILETKRDGHFAFVTEEDCWSYIKETIVSFIYTINQPSRSGLQSPYTNVSVYDKYFIESLKDQYLFPDGSTPDADVIMDIQELFIDIMNEELERTPITFPVTSACFSVDDEKNVKDEDFLFMISDKNRKFNFINNYAGKTSTVSGCCRLRSDMIELPGYVNSIGGGSTKLGSIGVCSINFPRLAIRADGDIDKYMELLEHLVITAARINHAKRSLIKKRIDSGNQPLYTHEFIELAKQYSTLGINGLNESVELMGMHVLENTGQEFVIDVMEKINSLHLEFDKRYHSLHNVEQVPGENMSIKIAQKDHLLRFQDQYEIYSNQFIPLTTNADMLDRIRLQGVFDSHFSGGSILHINIDTEVDTVERMAALTKFAIKSGVIYHALNPVLGQCANGHLSVTRGDICDVCGADITDHYQKIVGFLTNVKTWHETRRKLDFPNRQTYSDIEV